MSKKAPRLRPFTADRDAPMITEAVGCSVRRGDGRWLLDAASGAINVNIGYRDQEVLDAIARSLRVRCFVHPDDDCPERGDLLALLRTDWLPDDHSEVFFACTGSEAMEAAIKIALHYQSAIGAPERRGFASLRASYHGAGLAVMQLAGQRKVSAALAARDTTVVRIANPECNACPLALQYPSCRMACLDDLRHELRASHKHGIAAVIAEPIGGTSVGVVVPPNGYWQEVASLCRSSGALLIFDEALTGFGRVGARFAAEQWGVTPDLLVAGKGLAAGYGVITAVSVRDEIADVLKDRRIGLMTATMAAQPAACAAAVAVLGILVRHRLMERATALGTRLHAHLNGLRRHDPVKDVRGLGLFWAVEWNVPTGLVPSEVRTAAVRACESRGVVVYPAGVESDRAVTVVAPPLVCSDDDIDTIGRVLSDAAAVDMQEIQ